MEQIRLEVSEGLATITLWRPEQMNAFTDTMEHELIEAFDACDSDDSVNAIILTGSDRVFCAGMDLSASSGTFTEWRTSVDAPTGSQFQWRDDPLMMRRDGGGRVVLRMYELRKPIIAAISGHAVGVGATMTLAADARLAVENAKLGFVFTRIGIVPESCSSWFLPRIVGLPTALDWMMSGRIFGAAEALRAGLISQIHPDAESLWEAARALGRSLTADTAPVAVAVARRLLWDMASAPHPVVAHHRETIALNLRGVSGDAAEGIAAFLEKRPAKFPDSPAADLSELLDPFGTGTSIEVLPPGASPLHPDLGTHR